MSTDMLKGPVAFPGFNLEISFSISSVVVGKIKKESETGFKNQKPLYTWLVGK